MLDANLAVDDEKLAYITRLPGGRALLLNIMKENHTVQLSDIKDRFGINELLTDQSQDNRFLISKTFLPSGKSWLTGKNRSKNMPKSLKKDLGI